MKLTAHERLVEVIKPRLADPADMGEIIDELEHLLASVVEHFTRRPIPAPVDFREICRDLLGFHGLPSGTAPGSFRSSLFHAIYAADKVNRAKLLDFTGEVLAVTICETLGDDSVRKIAEAPEAEIEEIAFAIIKGMPDA